MTLEESRAFEALLQRNEDRAGRPQAYRLEADSLKESLRWPVGCTHGVEYCLPCICAGERAAERERCARQFSEIDGRICELMMEYGPDGHCDGSEMLTLYALELIAAERERCAKIAEETPLDAGRTPGWSADSMAGAHATAAEIAARIREGK